MTTPHNIRGASRAAIEAAVRGVFLVRDVEISDGSADGGIDVHVRLDGSYVDPASTLDRVRAVVRDAAPAGVNVRIFERFDEQDVRRCGFCDQSVFRVNGIPVDHEAPCGLLCVAGTSPLSPYRGRAHELHGFDGFGGDCVRCCPRT